MLANNIENDHNSIKRNKPLEENTGRKYTEIVLVFGLGMSGGGLMVTFSYLLSVLKVY